VCIFHCTRVIYSWTDNVE